MEAVNLKLPLGLPRMLPHKFIYNNLDESYRNVGNAIDNGIKHNDSDPWGGL